MASLDSATLLKRIVFGALIGAGIFLGSFYLARATSTFIVQQGGTGSTTLGGILKGNGTSPVGSVVVGSGLSYDGTTLSSTGGSGTVTQINTTWPILGGPITTTGTLTFGGLGTSTAAVVGNIPYFSGVNTFANVATTSVSSGTGISFSGTAGALVGGSNLTVTNSSPLSGLSASFPFSFSNPTLTWLGLGTSSPGITAGQPIYATGVNTIASVASSTFLTSIGGQATGNYITALTGDGTASGPGSAALTLATVNSNIGSFTNANITVNAKGLITAASNGSTGSSGLATSSPISSSNLLVYSTSGAGSAYGVATSTLTATSPLTGSFTQIGSGGSLGCQAASGSQAGCLSSADWTTFNGKQAAGSYITALTGDITASGPGSVAATLATVNSNVGTFTYPSVTVNGKGLITAISSGSAPTTYSATYPVTLSGSAFGLAFGTTTANSWSSLQQFNGNASTTGFTNSGSTWLTGLTSALLSTDSAGKVVATTTLGGNISVPAANLTGTVGVSNGGTNATSQTTPGVAYYDGSKITTNSSFTFIAGSNTLIVSTSRLTPTSLSLGSSIAMSLSGSDLQINNTSASNNLVFYGGGSNPERARIDSATGKFGVGTTSPWGQLSASSTSAYPTLAIDQQSTGPAAIFTGGNVGIATTSPSQKLSVTGNALISGIATGIVSSINGLLQDLSLSSGFSLTSNTLSQVEHRSFTYATSTAWTGTTTIPIESGYGEVFNSVRCFTDAGTLGVDFYHSTSHLNYIPTASTTNNVNTFSTNNTITSGDKTYVDLGTPASSPTKINCTVADTY